MALPQYRLFSPVAAPKLPAPSAPDAIDAKKLAASIILAGRRRRSEAPDAPQPPQPAPGPIDAKATAAQIIAAAKKARVPT
ncbi:MAG: hypothetical protein WCF81_21445 [Roseiarcus sp.]